VEGYCGHGDEHLYSAVEANEVKGSPMMLVGYYIEKSASHFTKLSVDGNPFTG
jgi:hypothetical protein